MRILQKECMSFCAFLFAMVRQPREHLREWGLVAVGLTFTLMMVWVDVPPITDLPQHLVQVQAFWWANKTQDGLFLINWFAPNSGYYFLLILCRLVFPIVLAGKVLWMILVWVQLGMLGRLARRLAMHPLAALMAALLCLNLNFYWGFGNFTLGWCWFLLYFQLPAENRGLAVRFVLYLCVYVSHVFWLPIMVILDLYDAWHSQPRVLNRWQTWVPMGLPALCSLAWFLGDFSSKSSGDIAYNHSLLERLSLDWLSSSALGGLQGYAEPFLVGCIILGLLIGVAGSDGGHGSTLAIRCRRMGLCLLVLGLLAPDKGLDTVRFSQRWIPFGVQLLLLGGFGWGRGLARKAFQAIACLAAGLWLFTTMSAWSAFQLEEVANLRKAISPLHPGVSYLTLDHHRFGRLFLTRASMHLGTYGQLEHQAFPAFGFADNAAAFVRYRKNAGFTKQLEWYPERLTIADLLRVDYVLANGGEDVHRSLASRGLLEPVNQEGHWRLYCVQKEKVRQ